jgi:hypothetical protein
LALFTLNSNAQDKVWDFGNDTTTWPTLASTTADRVGANAIDGLDLVAGAVNYGGVYTAGSTPVVFSDGYQTTRRFQTEGSSSGNAGAIPSTRFLRFPVTGPCKIKVYFGATSNSASRITKISDGTTVLAFAGTGDVTAAATSPFQQILEYDYTGTGTTLYVYSTASSWYYKVSVTYVPLSTGDFKAESISNVYANGSQVYVSNVKSNTTVTVYSLTGALVKTVETTSDASFNLESGVYVAKVKSAEGEKSVKLLVK